MNLYPYDEEDALPPESPEEPAYDEEVTGRVIVTVLLVVALILTVAAMVFFWVSRVPIEKLVQ